MSVEIEAACTLYRPNSSWASDPVVPNSKEWHRALQFGHVSSNSVWSESISPEFGTLLAIEGLRLCIGAFPRLLHPVPHPHMPSSKALLQQGLCWSPNPCLFPSTDGALSAPWYFPLRTYTQFSAGSGPDCLFGSLTSFPHSLLPLSDLLLLYFCPVLFTISY